MEHPGSRELMNFVNPVEWGSIPYTKHLKWERWGLFGILADYVLHYTKGDIIEVGVCETSIYLSFLARKHHRKTYHCDIQRSKIENCQTVEGYFNDDAVLVCDSSDNFFKNTEFTPIALSFIDGEHEFLQVRKDFENAYELTVDNGYIFLHDTYPKGEDWLHPNACGDVYRMRKYLEGRRDLFDVFTFDRSAWDVGLTMVRKKPKDLPYYRS